MLGGGCGRMGGWEIAKSSSGGARPPSLPCRASPPQGGRSDVITAFANHQCCSAGMEAANLPPRGGDVRQDREGASRRRLTKGGCSPIHQRQKFLRIALANHLVGRQRIADCRHFRRAQFDPGRRRVLLQVADLARPPYGLDTCKEGVRIDCLRRRGRSPLELLIELHAFPCTPFKSASDSHRIGDL